jgi:Family of unknown function (DUF5343)
VSEFPYTPNPASLKRFIEKIPAIGVPPKVNRDFLKSVGFKSGNDAYTIAILKTLKFLDDSGAPADNWQRYRNKGTGAAVMANAVRLAYPGLFTTYPDADRKDHEALRNYFSTHSKVGEATLGFIVRTFKTLSELGDFDADSPEIQHPDPSNPTVLRAATTPPVITATRTGPAVNINIQLQLQATEDASVYDKFFAAMKKHLFPSE